MARIYRRSTKLILANHLFCSLVLGLRSPFLDAYMPIPMGIYSYIHTFRLCSAPVERVHNPGLQNGFIAEWENMLQLRFHSLLLRQRFLVQDV